ncbi:MAG: hypothetical protein E7391_01050 [Ruminococcaceae bacterium]|nr:hypothetical protein [Oscillospiraceae bacterium]
MKRNTKYLWIYTGILFSIALVLILIAWVTQFTTRDEIESQTTGAKEGLVKVSNENSSLKEQLKEKDAQIANLNTEIEKYKTKETEWLSSKGIDETLATAYEKYLNGEKEEAKNMVKSSCDRTKLTKIQQKVYDIIIND